MGRGARDAELLLWAAIPLDTRRTVETFGARSGASCRRSRTAKSLLAALDQPLHYKSSAGHRIRKSARRGRQRRRALFPHDNSTVAVQGADGVERVRSATPLAARFARDAVIPIRF